VCVINVVVVVGRTEEKEVMIRQWRRYDEFLVKTSIKVVFFFFKKKRDMKRYISHIGGSTPIQTDVSNKGCCFVVV
jgi:hypothetical protein